MCFKPHHVMGGNINPIVPIGYIGTADNIHIFNIFMRILMIVNAMVLENSLLYEIGFFNFFQIWTLDVAAL